MYIVGNSALLSFLFSIRLRYSFSFTDIDDCDSSGPSPAPCQTPLPGNVCARTDVEGAERVEGAGTRAFCRDDSSINGHYLMRGRFLPGAVALRAGSE